MVGSNRVTVTVESNKHIDGTYAVLRVGLLRYRRARTLGACGKNFA